MTEYDDGGSLGENGPAAVGLDLDYPEIRESVASICAKFPSSYWREQEDAGTYPEAFVQEFTESGFLAALIPEEYGGAGLPLRAACVILEEIHASGWRAMRRCTSWAPCCGMGVRSKSNGICLTLLRVRFGCRRLG